ncbi:uncharacterized protein TOT_020000340 [Theileria orientalis strain Shintoku]|uniref:Protein kinase domain-containing protein n=1 Tax=Theileria orientalis strain Shintoku TaxID=869250 RepID=J4C3A0_THEOR|nr:uncharacterized protein TOT_020000340 [Theileria orientalis strain Shintoku]BAM40076.1 uncharacterized protein TOT_020000340 [Theileria orientalis strain Shintoku]|eukprot:XP_009690377.1 uncharacterized protein TOT_020000340 [Theileria orientalis strain Shintoku]
MEELFKLKKKDSTEKKSTSLQRSMDIFLRLTNLSMEWNMVCFVGSFVTHSEREKYWDEMHKKMAQSILDNIKTLKGCWVKLGQFLSTKSGFLPPYYLEALTQLQDVMPNSDFGEIIETLEEDLGFMDVVYGNFDSIPIASASIAQVHKAKLVDGSPVAVKVQHKSSEQNLMNDIEILKMITSMMHSAGIYPDIKDYFEEYASYAAKELDFTIEANNIELSHADVIRSKVPVKLPKLYSEYCSRHVITMQFFDLSKFTDKEFRSRHNVNMPQAIYDVHDFAIFQLMSCGRMHSDPHPGNLQLHYDPKEKKVYPVFLDWGFTTHIDDVSRLGLAKMYKSLFTHDPMGMISAMMEVKFTKIEAFPYRYDSLFDAFIGLFLSSYKLTFGNAFRDEPDTDEYIKKTREMQAKVNRLMQEFLVKFFKKAPNFVPLSLKVLLEYQSLSKMVKAYAPFLHLVYKNSSFALYSVYDSPLNYYYSRLGLPLLQSKLNAIKYKVNESLRRYTFYDMVEKVAQDSSRRNKNFRLFSELYITESKNLLESRLSDLLRHLYQDNSNLIAAQVGVIRKGAIEVELSFGNIDKYEKRPISNESLFPLFNMSSGLLTIAVLHLASIGKIGLNDRVHIYWPEFKQNKEFVTIRDVLEHKCGVIYTDYPFVDICTSRETMRKCVENARFFYHNRGVDYMVIFYGFILSEIITRVTKVPTEEFVMMLASMVGIDSANMLYPNPVVANTRNEEGDSDSESSSSECSHGDDFTKNLNLLFEQSVAVFGDQLPLLNLLNVKDTARGRPKPENIANTDECSNESDQEYSDSSEEQHARAKGKNKSGKMGDGSKNDRSKAHAKGMKKLKGGADERNSSLKIVSLDDNCLDSSFRHVNLDIEEFRKNLAFQSTVIDVPTDAKGRADATYYCSCYRYDKDFPDGELKRCYVPTKYCPVPNRLIRVFRGNAEDSVLPRYRKFIDTGELELPDGHYDSDYCSPVKQEDEVDVNSEEYISRKIRESFRRTFSKLYDSEDEKNSDLDPASEADPTENSQSNGQEKDGGPNASVKMGKLVKTRQKIRLSESSLVKLEGYTLNDLVRFKNNMIDPIVANYREFYENSVPFLNARANALSLALFYYSVLSGSLVSADLLAEVMKNNNHDKSFLHRFFLGMFQGRFSLGFQKFAFLDRDNNLCEGFGHSDISGSVVMGIPSHNLSITLFVSHCTRQYVTIKILKFILEHYGLRLIDCNVMDSNFYRALTLL